MFKSINIQSRQADPPKDPEKEEQFRDFGEFLQTVNTTRMTKPYGSKGNERQDPENVFLTWVSVPLAGLSYPNSLVTRLRWLTTSRNIQTPRTGHPGWRSARCRHHHPGLDQGNANGVYAGVQVTWIAEGAQKPETEPLFREIRLEPNEVAAHVVVTDKLLRNSAAAGALVSSLRKAIIAAEEDASCLVTVEANPWASSAILLLYR